MVLNCNTLPGKYWNNTLRSLCPVLDDSEGITLRSLGGVFIATLVGLGIAMLVLIVEVTLLSNVDNIGIRARICLLIQISYINY